MLIDIIKAHSGETISFGDVLVIKNYEVEENQDSLIITSKIDGRSVNLNKNIPVHNFKEFKKVKAIYLNTEIDEKEYLVRI